jgi:iron complex transport system permease protein
MHPVHPSARQRTITIVGTLLLAATACLLFSGVTGSVTVALAELPDAVLQLLHGRRIRWPPRCSHCALDAP